MVEVRYDYAYEVSIETIDGNVYGMNQYDSLEEAKSNMTDDLMECEAMYGEPSVLYIFETEAHYRNDSICSISDLEVYREEIQ